MFLFQSEQDFHNTSDPLGTVKQYSKIDVKY